MRRNNAVAAEHRGYTKWRTVSIFIAFFLLAIYVGYNIGVLQIIEANEWQARANERQLASTILQPRRGTIYDSGMRELAESAPVWTISTAPNVMAKSKLVNTAEKDPARLAAKELARLLGLDEEELYKNLSNKETLHYPINVKMNRELTDQVEALSTQYGLKGIYTEETSKRYYPYEDMAASVLGFMNSDGVGVYGIESQYEELLKGTPGRIISSRAGQMPGEQDAKTFPAEDGNNLVLTINVDIQRSLEEHLIKAVDRYHAAERGMGIVIDVNTGAILAMATKSDFNPNDPYYITDPMQREAIEAMPDGEEKDQARLNALYRQWRNKAVADTYEPGSVMKIISAAAALDSGQFTPSSSFVCSGAYTVADRTFGCAGGRTHGPLTLAKGLIESCNVCFIQVGQTLGVHTWYDYINAFGLTEPTGIDLPSEPTQAAINNLVYSEARMNAVELASCSFGQSNKYSALQMITAVSAAVNGGHLVQPHVVSKILDPQGNVLQDMTPPSKRQVISEETSIVLRGILEDLVSEGSLGKSAYVAGYHVGGKSGTSEKLDLLAQDETNKKYISSFVGVAPANDPQIAVLIVLDEPEDPEMGTYSGSRLAGPTVGAVISETAKILGIEPDYSEDELSRTTIVCPNLVDRGVQEAIVALNKEGLDYTLVGGGGTVLGQYPQAGTQVPRGGKVVLYTDGTELERQVPMPDVTGKNARAAIDILKGLGLNVLVSGAPEGDADVVVDTQSVPAGTMIPMGTVVSLVLKDSSQVSDLA